MLAQITKKKKHDKRNECNSWKEINWATQAYPLVCAALPCTITIYRLFFPSPSIYFTQEKNSMRLRMCVWVCSHWRAWAHIGLLSLCVHACLSVQRKWCGTLHPPYNSPGLIKRAKESFPAPATHSNGLVSVNKSCSYPCSGQIRGEGDLRSDGSRRGSQSSSLPSTALPP